MSEIPKEATYLIIVREGSMGGQWKLWQTATTSEQAVSKYTEAKRMNLDVIVANITSRHVVEYDSR